MAETILCAGHRAFGCVAAAAGWIDRASGVANNVTAVDPPVRIRVNGCARDSAPGRWRVEWRLTNLLHEPLSLQDAWLPHGRFRGDGHMPQDLRIAPGSDHYLGLFVRAEEAPGTVVENAFLILQVRTSQQGWRVFARMKVVFADGVPMPSVEAVTVQPL